MASHQEDDVLDFEPLLLEDHVESAAAAASTAPTPTAPAADAGADTAAAAPAPASAEAPAPAPAEAPSSRRWKREPPNREAKSASAGAGGGHDRVPCSVCGVCGHVGMDCPTKADERAARDASILAARSAQKQGDSAEKRVRKEEDGRHPGEPRADRGADFDRRRAERGGGARWGDEPLSQRHRSRERARRRSRSRSRSAARGKKSGAERDASRERRKVSERKSSRPSLTRSPKAAAPVPPAGSAGRDPVGCSLEGVLAEARTLKHAADAAGGSQALLLLLKSVLKFLAAAAMQPGDKAALLFSQTAALCDFAAARAEELLRAPPASPAAARLLHLARALALRLSLVCCARALALRRDALREEAAPLAPPNDAASAPPALLQRLARTVLDAVKVSETWERAAAAAQEALMEHDQAGRNANYEAAIAAIAALTANGGLDDMGVLLAGADSALATIERRALDLRHCGCD